MWCGAVWALQGWDKSWLIVDGMNPVLAGPLRVVPWCGVVWYDLVCAGAGQETNRGEARHGPGHDLAQELHHPSPFS